MTAIKFLLRVFSYLFHLAVSMFLTSIGLVGWMSESSSFSLGMVPWWSGTALIKILALGGMAGIAATLLAARGRFRVVFTLWTTTVFFAVVWGFFFSNYSFEGVDALRDAVCFAAAAALAWIGGVQQMFRKR